MTAALYAATALLLAWLCDRFIVSISRGAAIALLLLPLCFTGRALLTDRVYAPVEMAYISQPLSDHRAEMAIGPPHNPALSDIAFQMLPWRESLRRSLAEREWPLLNRFMLCGDVLAASGQPAVFNPFTLIACLLPAALSFTFTASITFFIAGLGAYAFARLLGCRDEAALVGAVGWMFSAVIALLILWPLGFAWSLLPFVLAATRLVVIEPGLRSVGTLAVTLALEIFAGHPETLLHVSAVGGIYGLFELARARGRSRAVAAAIASGGIAFLLTAIFVLPFLEALHQSREYWIRTAMYAPGPLRIRAGWARVAALGDLFPFVRARLNQPSLAPAEGGSIILALAVCAIWSVRSRYTWFFLAMLIFGFLAGVQAWPVAQILHRLPAFNVTLNDRLVALVPLSLSMLAALAIDHVSRSQMAAVMLTLLLGIGVAAFLFQSCGPIDNVRVLAEVVPLGIAAILVLGITSDKLTIPLLIGLLLIQRTLADGSLVPIHDRRAAFPPLRIFKALERIREPFRIVGKGPALLTNTATMYGLEDPHGSTAMTLRELAETYPLWITSAYGQFDQVNDLTRPILSMLNVRFALTSVWEAIPEGWHEVQIERDTRLIENERVLPRAFVPRRVRFGVSGEHEIEEMARETNFADRAWLDVPEQSHERANGPGRVSVQRRNLGLILEAFMERSGFVIITEAAWPGWRTYVDGKRVNTLRANHAFLAVYLPEGRHTVRLRYLPQSFVAGRVISAATALLLVLSGLWSGGLRTRRSTPQRRATGASRR